MSGDLIAVFNLNPKFILYMNKGFCFFIKILFLHFSENAFAERQLKLLFIIERKNWSMWTISLSSSNFLISIKVGDEEVEMQARRNENKILIQII